MLNHRKIKVLHLEPTDVCQAACPLCARETDSAFDSNQQHHLSWMQLLKVINQNQIAALEKTFMCGNYGDPAAGRHTLEIFRELRKLNPGIVLGMNSNGALRDQQWWTELATILNQPRDYVVFSIDGLEDTNHIYRKNVVWDKLVDNASAFIAAGGSAHWDMLIYQHNQHQIDAAIELSRSIGFSWFRAKVSKRPLTDNLQYPVNWVRSSVDSGPIKCIALKEQSLYVDCRGVAHPCCWQPTVSSIKEINKLEQSWNTKQPNTTCQATCTSNQNKNNFVNQWKFEIALK